MEGHNKTITQQFERNKMKKQYVYRALAGALIGTLMSLQSLSASQAQLTPGPVVKGVSLAAYANHWDMVSEVFVKQPRKEAIKQISFDKKTLIIPGITAAVTILGVKLFEYWYNGYNWRGYHKERKAATYREGYEDEGWKKGTDWAGFNQLGIKEDGRGHWVNRDNERTYDNGKPYDSFGGSASYAHSGYSDPNADDSTEKVPFGQKLRSFWQQTRWFVSSRAYNPYNWFAVKCGFAAGAVAFSPTIWGMAKEYAKNLKAAQEEQVDAIVAVWKEAKQFFPEELHNTFDTLHGLKTKKSSDYEVNRARALIIIRQGIAQCPVI